MAVGIVVQIPVEITRWKMSVPLLQPIIFAKNPHLFGRNNMKNYQILPEPKTPPAPKTLANWD